MVMAVLPEVQPQNPATIFQDQVEAGNQDQGNASGEHDAET